MFVLNGKPIALDRAFEHDGVQYPANWLRLASPEERAAIGIEERPNPPTWDQRFYWGYDENGSLIPKRLNDEPSFDEDGNVMVDESGERIMQTGLKTQWIAEQKRTAASLLASTDWYVVRRGETGAAIPPEILTYREEVRSVSDEREEQIAACTTVDELKELLYGSQYVYVNETNPETGEEEMVQMPNPSIATPWPQLAE